MAFGFKHGVSGAAAFGFEVVSGTVRPASPKEATIWAKGLASMGSWAVSPTEPHRISKNTNLIVYPYRVGTAVNSGVTFTVTSGGSDKGMITVNGTNTSSGSIVYRISNKGLADRELLLQPGVYFLNGNCSGSSSGTHRLGLIWTYDNWKTEAGSAYDNGSGAKVTITKDAKARVSIQVMGRQTVNGAVYRPQLSRGSAATAYELGDASGQVWVRTDPAGDILMNALKKSGVSFRPTAVYEYTESDGWTARSGEVYQYGAWTALKEPWDGYYFKDGEQYTDVTGGWTKDGWGGTGSVTVGSTLVATGTGGDAVVGTADPVDLSGVSKVWIDSPKGNNGYGFGYMFIAKSKSVASSESVAYVQVTKAGSFGIDVSSLSGKYYIYLYAAATSYVDARAIWME